MDAPPVTTAVTEATPDSQPLPAPPRGIGLEDLVVIVLSAAGGLTLARDRNRVPAWDHLLELQRTPEWARRIELIAGSVAIWACLSLGLRVGRSRGDVVGVLRQPGAVACLAVVVTVSWRLVGFVLSLLAYESFASQPPRGVIWSPLPRPSLQFVEDALCNAYLHGSVISVAWLVLALNPDRRRSRDGLDWLGVGMGVAYISISLFGYIWSYL